MRPADPYTNEVFISYAWGNETTEGKARGHVADGLCDALRNNGIKVYRDRDELAPGDRVSEFMSRLINSGYIVIIVLSDAYLRSVPCMVELFGIYRCCEHDAGKFLKRVIPIVLPDAKISKLDDRLKRVKYWHERRSELMSEIEPIGFENIGIEAYKELSLVKEFEQSLGDMLAFIHDKLVDRDLPRMERNGFQEIADIVSKRSSIPLQTPQTSPSSGTMPRRDFLGLSVLIVAAAVSPSLFKYIKSLQTPPPPPDEATRARLVELLGFSFADQVALMPNWENVAVNKKVSAPTPSWVTAQAVSEVANILREQHVPTSEVDAPWDYQPSIEHLVAFGFETSQPLYRRVAGLKQFDKTRKNSEFQGYDRHNQTGPFDLPWKSNLGTEADENDPKEFYYTLIGADKEKTKRRVWALQQGGTILRPEFEGNNVCITDFISIVHIPNYLNSSKYTMTLAGGIQAAGTKAIGGLFADKTVMETILDKAPMLSPWQAIIRVSFVGPKLQPTFLVQDVAPIGINEHILADWRRVPPTF